MLKARAREDETLRVRRAFMEMVGGGRGLERMRRPSRDVAATYLVLTQAGWATKTGTFSALPTWLNPVRLAFLTKISYQN